MQRSMSPDTTLAVLQPPRRAPRYLEQMAQVAEHVEGHLDAPLDTAGLAALAGMSPYHFQRMFRACFGTTVQGYVTWRRLRRAADLLAGARMPVLEVALSVGYESAQALAKAMRRELDATPTAVRAGAGLRWQRLFAPSEGPVAGRHSSLAPRLVELPVLRTLTAAGHGIRGGDMREAAAQAYGQLLPALEATGLASLVRGYLALIPELPEGPDDPHCCFLGGVMFDAAPPAGLASHGKLRWHELAAGGYAVFRHEGPCSGLYALWMSIYRDWLPATRYVLRDAPAFEVYVDVPQQLPDDGSIRADVYLPLE